MIIWSEVYRGSMMRAARIGVVEIFLLTIVMGMPQILRGASSTQTPPKSSEVMVYTAADEYSPLIETVRDGGAFSPIGEMTGAGGAKWFMVKTKNGNVGWIMASDNVDAKKIDDHFRAL